MSDAIERGQVWWADLGTPRGSEPALRRPVIVVQCDELNRSRLKTVMVVPLTSNMKRGSAIGNVALSKKQSGLKIDSVALACQVETLDRVFLDALIHTLDVPSLVRLDAALRLNLKLDTSR